MHYEILDKKRINILPKFKLWQNSFYLAGGTALALHYAIGVIFVLVKDSKILMQLRDENCKRFPLMWCLPGGGSEIGESYDDTLLREAEEEYMIKLDFSQCKTLFDFEKNDEVSRVYVCNLLENQHPVLREGKAMKWMKIEEIENTKLGFDQDKIIPLIKAELFE